MAPTPPYRKNDKRSKLWVQDPHSPIGLSIGQFGLDLCSTWNRSNHFESLRFGLVVEDSVVANLFSVRIGDEELTEIWLKLVEIRQIWKKMAEFSEILPNFYKIWVDLNRSDLK